MSEQIEQKIKLVEKMMELYCKKHHQSDDSCLLCEECDALLEYSSKRSRNCRNPKGFCAHCPHPCYAPDFRAKMRAVMKFSGPRMLGYHPIWVLKHRIETRRKKRERRKKSGRNQGIQGNYEDILHYIGLSCSGTGGIGCCFAHDASLSIFATFLYLFWKVLGKVVKLACIHQALQGQFRIMGGQKRHEQGSKIAYLHHSHPDYAI